MGARGPARDDPETAKAKGSNRQSGRAKEGFPMPPNERPQMPTWLGAGLVDFWDEAVEQLFQMGVAATCDRHALAAMVESFGAYQDALTAYRGIAPEDRYAVSRGGAPVKHPAIGEVNVARKEFLAACKAFGFLPTERQRLRANKGNQKGAPEDKFKPGGK